MECSFYDVGCHFSWFQEEIKLFFVWVWEQILSGLSSLIGAIPVPDFLLNANGLGSGLAPSMLYFMNLFQLQTGLVIVVSAYTLRFLVRRIPVVG